MSTSNPLEKSADPLSSPRFALASVEFPSVTLTLTCLALPWTSLDACCLVVQYCAVCYPAVACSAVLREEIFEAFKLRKTVGRISVKSLHHAYSVASVSNWALDVDEMVSYRHHVAQLLCALRCSSGTWPEFVHAWQGLALTCVPSTALFRIGGSLKKYSFQTGGRKGERGEPMPCCLYVQSEDMSKSINLFTFSVSPRVLWLVRLDLQLVTLLILQHPLIAPWCSSCTCLLITTDNLYRISF